MTRVHSIKTRTLHCHALLAVAGAQCELATNSPELTSALSAWRRELAKNHACDFTLNVLVDGTPYGAHRRPFFRGLHHLVIATFDESNVFIFDLLRRTVNAVVTRNIASDTEFWKGTAFPLIVGVLGVAIGVLPVHCACLSNNGEGLLIAGVSGSGKSTLSVALAQEGLDLVSDDWTYVSTFTGRLFAYGMSAPVKLLPDAVQHFPSVSSLQITRTLNGELAYELNPERQLGVNVASVCEPRLLVFPERVESSESELISIPPTHTKAYIEASVELLPAQLVNAERERERLIRTLAELPAWRFQYDGTPQFAAQKLMHLLDKEKDIAA